MRKPTIQHALAAVALLAPGEQPSEEQVSMLSAEMANWQTIFAKMNTLATSHASLIVLRAMLVHEAVRDEGPRDMVVYRIVARHERISTRLRLDALAEVMPALKTGLRRTPLSH